MPKISELPAGNALNGSELIAIVQEGETRKTSLSALVSAVTPSVTNARWIRISGQESPINETEVTTNSGDWNNNEFSITAAVDSVKSGADVLWWHHSFQSVPVLNDYNGYVGDLSDGQDLTLSEGRYTIGLYAAGPQLDGTITYTVNGGGGGTITVIGEYEEILVPIGEEHLVAVSAANGAIARIFQTGGFYYGGDTMPDIYDHSEQLNVRYWDTPKNGILTATARIYRDGVMVEESDEITLTVNATSNEPPQ